MGYQPKYAAPRSQTSHNQPPKNPPSQKQNPESRQKKSVVRTVLFVLLGIVVIPVSLVLTWHLLTGMAQNVGRPKPAAQAKTADMAIREQIMDYAAQEVSTVRSALMAQERPQEEIPEEPAAAVSAEQQTPDEETPQEEVSQEAAQKEISQEETHREEAPEEGTPQQEAPKASQKEEAGQEEASREEETAEEANPGEEAADETSGLAQRGGEAEC